MRISSFEPERRVKSLGFVIVRVGTDCQVAARQGLRLDLAGIDQATSDASTAKVRFREQVMHVHSARAELKLDQAAHGSVSDQLCAHFSDQN